MSYIHQNPHKAPNIIMIMIGLIIPTKFTRDIGKTNLAIKAPSANSNSVAITQKPPWISEVSKAKKGARTAANRIMSEAEDAFKKKRDTRPLLIKVIEIKQRESI
jgi:hypothetical protein